MSPPARERLGTVSHVPDAVAEGESSPLRRYLQECGPADSFAVTFRIRGGRRAPVRLSCILSSPHRLLLSADVRERATDSLAAAGQELATLQSRTLQNYFRLLRAQQALDGRMHRVRRAPSISEHLERERARMARELHSGAGQTFAAIRLQLELIERHADRLPEEVRGYLERIASLARAADSEVRAISHWLHPPNWQALGLTEALQNLWDSSGVSERFRGSLTMAPLTQEPAHELRVGLYRIAQEAIANAMRHSGAATLNLRLEESDGCLRMRIEDDGKGFDAGRTAPAQGIGLRSIREYVKQLGGGLDIRSGPDGTKLEIAIPLEASDQ
jgi:signal transduction histidine kinase